MTQHKSLLPLAKILLIRQEDHGILAEMLSSSSKIVWEKLGRMSSQDSYPMGVLKDLDSVSNRSNCPPADLYISRQRRQNLPRFQLSVPAQRINMLHITPVTIKSGKSTGSLKHWQGQTEGNPRIKARWTHLVD